MNQDFIIRICKEKNLFEKIIAKFPNLYAYMVGVNQNVSQEHVKSCIEHIIEACDKNNEVKELFLKLEGEGESPKNENNDVAGMIFVIDKKEESYHRLIQTAKKEKWQYKGIAIVEQFDSLRLYFY